MICRWALSSGNSTHAPPRQFQQPVRVGHYLSQQRRPRSAVRPVNRRLALDAGTQVLVVPLAFGPFGSVPSSSVKARHPF